MSDSPTEGERLQEQLRVVEARIEFLSRDEPMRALFMGWLAELKEERRRLRVQLERAFNAKGPAA